MRLRTSAALLLISSVVMLASQSTAHDGRGGLTLEPRLSPRALSLGETGLTETCQAAGFATNAACLSRATSIQVAASYGDLIEGVSASVASAAITVPVGAPIEYVEGDPVMRRYGLGIGMDHRGFELAQGSSWTSETVSLGFAWNVTTYASVGVLSKLIFTGSDVDNAGANGFGFDIGSRAALHPRLDLALVLRNLIASTSWDDGEDETPPFTVNFGASFVLVRNACTEFALSVIDDQTKYGIGLDIPLIPAFHIRFGYLRHSADYSRDVLTGGFGFQAGTLGLAYGVRNDEDEAFGLTHHVSVSASFH